MKKIVLVVSIFVVGAVSSHVWAEYVQPSGAVVLTAEEAGVVKAELAAQADEINKLRAILSQLAPPPKSECV